jgi:hypothetical protein
MNSCSSSYPIPPSSLEKCEICGEYKGIVYEHQTPIETLNVLVECLCDGEFCRNCKKNRVHRPISNYFNESSGRIIHVPHFGPCICSECQPVIKQQEREERLKSRKNYIREARSLARDLDLHFVGIWDHGMESDVVIEYRLTGERIIARIEDVTWKIPGEFSMTIETYGGFKQIFPKRMPEDNEILSPNEWINKKDPWDF